MILAALHGEMLNLLLFVGQFLETPVVGEVQELDPQVVGVADVLAGPLPVLLVQKQAARNQRRTFRAKIAIR
jgi:hypothetical protein